MPRAIETDEGAREASCECAQFFPRDSALPSLHLREPVHPRSTGIFPASLWKLARQPYYWASGRFFRLAWTLAKNIPTHVKVMRLLSRAEYSRLIAINPRFALKWMGTDYLARGLKTSQQAECFVHHYRSLPNLFPEPVLGHVLHGEILLDEIYAERNRCTIKMGLSRPWDYEGELSLNFEVNGRFVFVLSFTIVPGWIVESDAKEVLLISRVQGVKGCFREIQLATRAMSDVAPPAVLFAALCGFAQAFGFDEAAGINARMKPEWHLCEGEQGHIEQAYDEFFSELGARKGLGDFYLSQLPPPEKSLALVKRGHKTRTRTKRALKRDIAQRVCRLLCETCGRS